MTRDADPSDWTQHSERLTADRDALFRGGLPDFLTVEEAARLLRIGRTAAYELTRQCATPAAVRVYRWCAWAAYCGCRCASSNVSLAAS